MPAYSLGSLIQEHNNDLFLLIYIIHIHVHAFVALCISIV